MVDAVSDSMPGSEAALGIVSLGNLLDSAMLVQLETVPAAAAGGTPPDRVSNACV